MGYVHLEVETVQTPKRPHTCCGDVVLVDRQASATTVLLCDGLGSGVKAQVSATACGTRIRALLREGFSPRAAFDRVIRTMNDARTTDLPFSAFALLRVGTDGATTIILYEMPDVLLLGTGHAAVLASRKRSVEGAVIGEVNCHLMPGEGILLVSDGITQAGIGTGWRNGWGIEEAARFASSRLAEGLPIAALPREVHDRAREIWGPGPGDDCTAVLASCRTGLSVTILTGPPSDRARDREVVLDFLQRDGARVVCGGTTAGIVARVRGTTVEVEPETEGSVAPPRYRIEGIDSVTEGAITLNQLYNIWGESPGRLEEESGVAELLSLLSEADRVTFIVGGARNPASDSVSYRQQGILGRERIIPLLADRLTADGKLVIVERV
jgi:hypothetical protein